MRREKQNPHHLTVCGQETDLFFFALWLWEGHIESFRLSRHSSCRYLSNKIKRGPIGPQTKKLCQFYFTDPVFVCYTQRGQGFFVAMPTEHPCGIYYLCLRLDKQKMIGVVFRRPCRCQKRGRRCDERSKINTIWLFEARKPIVFFYIIIGLSSRIILPLTT